KVPKSRCAAKISARESSRPGSPEGSGRATCRSQSGWWGRLLSKSNSPARNTLPHPDKDRDRVSPCTSTAPEEPCRNKREVKERSKEHLLQYRATAGAEFAQAMARSSVLRLPVRPCLSLYKFLQILIRQFWLLSISVCLSKAMQDWCPPDQFRPITSLSMESYRTAYRFQPISLLPQFEAVPTTSELANLVLKLDGYL